LRVPELAQGVLQQKTSLSAIHLLSITNELTSMSFLVSMASVTTFRLRQELNCEHATGKAGKSNTLMPPKEEGTRLTGETRCSCSPGAENHP
jgi:hypothetical protein